MRNYSPQRWSARESRGAEPDEPGVLRILVRSALFFPYLPLMVLALASLLLLAGCQKSAFEPVAIAPEDVCAYCKMAISEKRYAAEVLDPEGEAHKFDDIGCMLNFIKGQQNKAQVVIYFVTDFDDRQWVRAHDAYFVHSTELKTPMSGQLLAFRHNAKAQEAAGRYHGKLQRFNDLFNR